MVKLLAFNCNSRHTKLKQQFGPQKTHISFVASSESKLRSCKQAPNNKKNLDKECLFPSSNNFVYLTLIKQESAKSQIF